MKALPLLSSLRLQDRASENQVSVLKYKFIKGDWIICRSGVFFDWQHFSRSKL